MGTLRRLVELLTVYIPANYHQFHPQACCATQSMHYTASQNSALHGHGSIGEHALELLNFTGHALQLSAYTASQSFALHGHGSIEGNALDSGLRP